MSKNCAAGGKKSEGSLKIGIIGGSGLDDPDMFTDRQEKTVTTPYGNPSDALIVGKIEGIEVILLSRHDRLHSTNPSNVNYRANVWALQQEGVTHIIATNACGSLQEEYKPGDIVVVDNFIDRTTKREQTFYDGTFLEGVCHLPIEPPYSESLRQVIICTAKAIGEQVHEKGTIVVIEGPRFSSKAESLMYKTWGGHLMNMTAVPELVLAKEAGMLYACIALVTDYDCWREDDQKVAVEKVVATFKANVTKVTSLLKALVPAIAKREWGEDIKEIKAIAGRNIQSKKK